MPVCRYTYGILLDAHTVREDHVARAFGTSFSHSLLFLATTMITSRRVSVTGNNVARPEFTDFLQW